MVPAGCRLAVARWRSITARRSARLGGPSSEVRRTTISSCSRSSESTSTRSSSPRSSFRVAGSRIAADFHSSEGRSRNGHGRSGRWYELRLQQIAELGDHARSAHVASTGVPELVDVDRPGDVRVAMPEQERDLIHALARYEGSACGRVSEAVHRGKRTARNGKWTALLVQRMKLGEGRIPVLVARLPTGTLSTRHVADAEKMAMTAYPVIYVFENAVREFLDGHLSAAYGASWFGDPDIVSTGIRETVERNRQAEAKARYHSQRNARAIYYTNLDQLSSIVKTKKGIRVFQGIFPRDTWFPELVGRFEVSRNIVAHMNPLTKRDISRLQDGLQEWLDQTGSYPAPD